MILLILHKLILVAPNLVGPIMMLATGDAHDAAAGDHSDGGHGGGTHLPNLIYMLFGPDSFANHWVNVIFAFAIGIILSLVALRVYSKREMIPGKFQNAIEMMVEGMYNFIASILGEKEARVYVPYLGSLFFYILFMNWLGMIPFGHSPTTSLNITASLALLTFFYAQSVGVKRLGIGGYLHHLAGSPADVIGWCMVPLLFPIHIIGELAKPFSLALRLFGNITGEDTLVAVFIGLGIALLSFSPVGLPLQLPFYFLGLLLSSIQALVFTLLSCIYILLMLPHEEHAH
ncbi:MAG: F0F1 ATP synthase subunit A [candidate division Zixibacteria bacterium]|nr:F0F1 ATP synthase subunit A [candidate division Zixibacteria bacterium]